MKKLNITFHNPNSDELTSKKLAEILSKEIVHKLINTNTLSTIKTTYQKTT